MNWHKNIAEYFAEQPHFLDGEKQKKPNVRKCVELPWQETKGERWDEVTETLCDLDFIQAKCAAKHTYDLINDYNVLLAVIPDYVENIRKEKERQARLDKYAKDLVQYSKGEISDLYVPESIIPWSEEKTNAEIARIKTNPSRVDSLKDFYNFLGYEADNLQKHAKEIPHLATQQAWNHADIGPVGKAAGKKPMEVLNQLLLRTAPTRPSWNFYPQILKTLKGHEGEVRAVAIFPNGKMALSASRDTTCILWDLESGRILKTLKGNNGKVFGHTGMLDAVAITPDGKLALSAGDNCELWDLGSGRLLKTFRGNNRKVNTVAITPDGKLALSGSDVDNMAQSDPICILWDLESGMPLKSLKGHTSSVQAVAITPDGKLALSGSSDKTCILWDLESGLPLKTFKGHADHVDAVAITPDGKRALSGSMDKTCILWDLESGMPRKTIKGHTDRIKAMEVTPDGKMALSGSSDKTCILWDLESGMPLKTLDPPFKKNVYRGIVTAVAITPDGKMALLGYQKEGIIPWDLEIGMPCETLKSNTGDVNAVAITPDGRMALSGSYGFCIPWDLEIGMPCETLKGHKERFINTVAITPDGKLALSGSDDNTCILWDLESSRPLKTLKGHTGAINAVVITPDGKMALSASKDTTCILWDLQSGMPSKTLKGHNDCVHAVTIKPDGKIALSGSDDNTCILWDLESGEKRAQFFTTSDIRAITSFPRGIIGGNGNGETFIIHAHRKLLCPGIGIITARQIWDFEFKHYQPSSADCPFCGVRFTPPKLVLDTIAEITKRTGLSPEQSPCLELPKEVWEEQGLISKCPQCGEDMKFNPFIVDNSEKEELSKTKAELGFADLNRQRIHEAKREYKEAIRIYYNNLDAHIGLGTVFWREGQILEACREYRIASKIRKDNKLEHFIRHAMLGLRQMEKGNTRKAKSEFKLGVELGFDPGSPFPNHKWQFWKK